MTKQLMRVKFGSHLYGTQTPTSDTDYKSIHVPSAKSLVMQNADKVLSRSTGSSKVKNTADDIDDESYSILKFFSMLKKGDMVAAEILMVSPGIAETSAPEWESVIRANKHEFISRDIRGFVQYCMRQSAKYGVKGSRIATMRYCVEMFNTWGITYGWTTKIRDVPDFRHFLDCFVALHEHAAVISLPVTKGSEETQEFLEVCDRKMGFNVAIKEAYSVYKKVFDEYGARSIAAESNQGVDWKAMYHAIRVSEQAAELLTTGSIIFPRHNAAQLLEIKRGEHSFAEIGGQLEDNLERLLELMPKSVLPPTINEELMDEITHDLHLKKIKSHYDLVPSIFDAETYDW